LFNFVVNEDKYYLRFDGEPKKKWEFKLDLNTEGGLNLSNQLKNKKEVEKEFDIYQNEFCIDYSLLYKQSSLGFVETAALNIVACNPPEVCFVYKNNDAPNAPFDNCQKIGQVIDKEEFTEEKLGTLPFNAGEEEGVYTINLVLAYENIGKPDTAEINKKIILIKIFGLSILIILLITKFIVK